MSALRAKFKNQNAKCKFAIQNLKLLKGMGIETLEKKQEKEPLQQVIELAEEKRSLGIGELHFVGWCFSVGCDFNFALHYCSNSCESHRIWI